MNVTEKCGRGQFLCAKNTCVHPRMICNGIKDCEDGSDEMHCGKNVSINLSKIIPSPDQIMNGTHIEPSNWAYFRNGSRGGSKYLVIDSIMSFYDAQQRCKVLGGGVAGHLAHINTIQEQLFIESYISKLMARHKISKSGSGFWIGAVRDRKDPGGMCMHNQWQWKDAEKRTLGYISGFTAFAPEKPDDVYSPEECLYISHILGDDPARFLKWDDAACDLQGTSGIKVLCEIDMNRIDYGSSGR
ncbi:DgyrCDS13708 [Dimorphilus gyrociliatus]|uniref:DgyrCDS13708 n=1 Tax=Dimorphilus gyrociliatus TaxID=2664684 RepID=A0A7I8WBI2_9ANNE|nr:DgyrCDS13708 [Dimorphilus gyrociliatus]